MSRHKKARGAANSRFYTTYRLLPLIKETVVVVGGPGFGAFYDETDPGFEKLENRKKLTLIRQARRDSLFLDAIFKVIYRCLFCHFNTLMDRNSP